MAKKSKIEKMNLKLKAALIVILALAGSFIQLPRSYAENIVLVFPWIRKPPSELTFDQCHKAMEHDGTYWWSKNKCHAKFIRYAAGVALEPMNAIENSSVKRKRGDVFSFITQYRPQDKLYCEKGGYCWPSSGILLLGSITTGPLNEIKLGDETDTWLSVGSTCELILSDTKNIKKFDAIELLKECQ